ncbi:nucleotidyl transferase AbiEii/AbiGii toxin family protein [Candidatus Amesbacteria bacterium]|nr:nucleotidyl transferase AbiEii/AbiGii toxin family protein [Candidatus Amesbacteria bacterium]
MKVLDITKHKTQLVNILLDIYKDSELGGVLGFKGGTAAMLFHNLPRFSVDLDFDLLTKSDLVVGRMTKLLSAKYDIKDSSSKLRTLFWLVGYGAGSAHIKVEISVRDNPYNHYDLSPFLGVSIRTLNIKDMMAHKLVAVMERTSIANRDLFDIHYFLGRTESSDINHDIIRHRTNKSPKEFYKSLLNFVSRIDNKNILAGLGEVLTPSQKDWAKAKLKVELENLIKKMIYLN